MIRYFLFQQIICATIVAHKQCFYDNDRSSDDLPRLIVVNHSEIVNINSKVVSCLKNSPYAAAIQTTNWRVPSNVQKHYDELLKATAKYREYPVHEWTGYLGPWIENHFISHFIKKPLNYFNGLIPIFIQWVDIQVNHSNKEDKVFKEILDLLRKLLKPDAVYFTVSQSDVGLYLVGQGLPNLLVFSAGGFGHVPIPLIKGEQFLVDSLPRINSSFQKTFAFFGSEFHHGRDEVMNPVLKSITAASSKELTIDHAESVPDWKSRMANAKFNLAPRGYGRSSFRYAEIIQMGMVPIFLYNDIPWIPYQGTKYGPEKIGYAAAVIKDASTSPIKNDYINYPSFDDVLAEISSSSSNSGNYYDSSNISTSSNNGSNNSNNSNSRSSSQHYPSTYADKLKAVEEVRHLYTYQGVLKQIDLFLRDPFGENGGFLRCVRHPKNLRCCDGSDRVMPKRMLLEEEDEERGGGLLPTRSHYAEHD